ncbi:MAG: site-specific DNA-methyltransferase [Candidatus Sabulitectum sp.]|nr:site-specific DNA-methyltransferase [Candidatus Sabulitectum sp.]
MDTLFSHSTSSYPIRCSPETPVHIVTGDVREQLALVPDNTFDSCITSPPYWGMRDYGLTGQIGAEDDINDYISKLVRVFREVRRTLKTEGTFWLNIGNTYTSGGRKWRDSDTKNAGRAMLYRPDTPKGLKKKDLIGMAWMLAMALQQDGWYLRSDIIWQKPNCQPESVKDRVTVSHEYLFMLTKSEKYYFDQNAVKEPRDDGKGLKNKRTVWRINTEPCKEAHFAVFPRALVRPCIFAGCPQDGVILDPFFGSGTVGVVAIETGRRCLGIELKEDYTIIAKKRLSLLQPDLFAKFS